MTDSKVAKAKIFMVCPDCFGIISVEGEACNCSQTDGGRWRKVRDGWQYVIPQPQAVPQMDCSGRSCDKCTYNGAC